MITFVEFTEYRDVPGYPYYKVGDDGSVWTRWRDDGVNNQHRRKWLENTYAPARLHHSNGRILAPMHPGLGQVRVHWLVLFAFVGPRPEGMECLHLNDDPSDNKLINLKWGTRAENQQMCVAHGRKNTPRGERNYTSVFTEDEVRAIRKAHAEGVGLKELAAEYCAPKTSISNIVHRYSWKWLE